jgi:hypothetical protein
VGNLGSYNGNGNGAYNTGNQNGNGNGLYNIGDLNGNGNGRGNLGSNNGNSNGGYNTGSNNGNNNGIGNVGSGNGNGNGNGNAGGKGDPILTGFDGRSFEFKGEAGQYYSILSERFHLVRGIPSFSPSLPCLCKSILEVSAAEGHALHVCASTCVGRLWSRDKLGCLLHARGG